MNSSSKHTWNSYADLYDEVQGNTGDIAHQLIYDPKISEMLGNLNNKVVLDAGCGNGYWTRKLAKHAKKVIGIDSSKKLITIAKTKINPKNIDFRIMDLTKKLDFADNTFDTILSSMVLNYVSTLKMVALEFRRILKPTGNLIICVQHPIYQYHYRAQEKVGKKSSTFPVTLGYFDRKPLKQITLFGKAVLEIYNRPLEDYIHAFIKNNFILSGFSEPEFTKELLEKNPRYKEVKEIPRVVIMKFTKKTIK